MAQKKRKVAGEHIRISSLTLLKIKAWIDIVARNTIQNYYGRINDIQDEQFVIIDDMLCVEVGVRLDSGQSICHRLVLAPGEWVFSEICN